MGPRGSQLPNLHVRCPPLPTSKKVIAHPARERGYVQIHADLRTRPLLAQVLECDQDRWQQPEDVPVSLHIPMAALNYVAEEHANGPSVFYRGRNILQIYLVVLADCLHAANRCGTPPLKP